MTVNELVPATKSTFYFVGMTTGKSSIMRVFPKWAEHLGLADTSIAGIDCKWHDEPEVYRRVVDFIKHDPLSVGALVTTHKIDLLTAARSSFDYLDPYAELLGEISSISKSQGRLRGHAKDPFTSGYSLEAIVDPDYWRRTGADLCILGAGGSSLALSAYLMMEKPAAERPARIIVTNRSPARLQEMERIHGRINPGIEVEYVLAPTPRDNDAVVARLAPGSVVANATGLGKDAPGSPTTDDVRFPERAVVWDFNYRGDLRFLEQARGQGAEKSLRVEDGWVYFLHGWTRVISEVFHIEIPSNGGAFEALGEIAAAVR